MTAAGLFDQSLAAFALHAVWQVPLLAGAAWMALHVGRPKVRVAHGLWVATLILCVAAPLLSTWQGYRAARARAQISAASISYSADAVARDLPAMQREPAWLRLVHKHFNTVDGVKPFAFALPPRVARGIAVVYTFLFAFACVQLGIAWRRSRVLVRAAMANVPQEFVDVMQAQCEAMDCSAPLVAMSDDIAGPLLAGVLQPTLLLPSGSVYEMSLPEMEAVLAHELSHLKRKDPALHALCAFLLLPVSFHPVARWVAMRIRQTREMACDEAAAAHLGSTSRYAHALLRVAERMATIPALPFGMGLGLFDVVSVHAVSVRDGWPLSQRKSATAGLELFGAQGAMEERMQSMMKQSTMTSRSGRWTRGLAAATIAAGGMIAACMIQVQPTFAAQANVTERPADERPSQQVQYEVQENRSPALVSGHSAQKQFGDTDRRLTDAQANATTDDDRSRIATEQQMYLKIVQADQQKALALQKKLSSPELQKRLQAQGEDAIRLKRNAQIKDQMVEAKRATNDTIMIAKLEPPLLLVEPQEEPKTPKVSAGVMAGNILNKVQPIYPQSAKDAKVSGSVVLHAVIDESGKVERLTVVSSPDKELSKSAIEAVQHWTYKPYLLNGRPTAVDTTITVNYSFAG